MGEEAAREGGKKAVPHTKKNKIIRLAWAFGWKEIWCHKEGDSAKEGFVVLWMGKDGKGGNKGKRQIGYKRQK